MNLADELRGVASVRALHRDGQLAARYPLVRGLLASMSEPEREAAGRILAQLDPDHVLAAHPDQAALAMAITGHGTLAALIPALSMELARHGLLLRHHLTDFDGYIPSLSNLDSPLYTFKPEVILCVLDPALVFDEVPVPWEPEDVARVLAGKLRRLEDLAGRVRDAGDSVLVLNTMPLPRTAAGQLVSYQDRARLGALWREANAGLLRLGVRLPGVVVIDLDPLVAEGVPVTDARADVYAGAHLSAELLARYAREIGHLARHLTGRTRKCLVLDLDQTLWGGVLAEDGPEGIEIGDGYRGTAFTGFQRVVKQLGAQGVLLAVVSKNDPGPVRAALAGTRMTLTAEDLVRVTANWSPKHDNIRDLAHALNLGLDALVFVDDSPYERGLVERELPEVAVVPVDDEPAFHIGQLLRDGWFDVIALTREDRRRTVSYRQEEQRKDFLDGFASLADYLNELGVTVRLAVPPPDELARISQITLRTNQFNLTTVRQQPAEVAQALAAPDRLVLAIHARDRFGDNGLVGAIFGRRAGDGLHIDNFLLSCRVFSRGIEQACLSAVLRHARDTGAAAVYGYHRPSAKNSTVREFYPRYGFTVVAAGPDGTTFRHDLREIVDPPGHINLTVDLEGRRP